MIDKKRLHIGRGGTAGCRIAGMADRHTAFGKRVQSLFAEYFRNKSRRLMRNKDAVIVDNNSASFLAPVLQSIQTGADNPADISGLFCKDAENAAFFMNTHLHVLSFRSDWYSPSAIHPLPRRIPALRGWPRQPGKLPCACRRS